MERPPPSRWSRLFGFGGVRLGLSTVGVLALLVVACSFLLVRGYDQTVAPAVAASAPGARQEWPTTQPVRIQFSKPMDHASVEGSLRISPPGERDRLPLSWDSNTLVVGASRTASVPLLPNTDYTIMILADARDRYGNALGQVWTLSFHTGSATALTQPTATHTPTPSPTPGQAPSVAQSQPTAAATAPALPVAPETSQSPATRQPQTAQSTATENSPATRSDVPTAAPAPASPTPKPAQTPTPTPAVTVTPARPTAQPTVAPTAAPAATTAPTPSPSAAAETPTPAPTPAPTDSPATATATSAAGTPTRSSIPVVGALGSVYWSNVDVQTKLGLPSAPEVKVNTAELSFQHGVMYERYDTGRIYVLLTDGQWSAAQDSWTSDDDPGGQACGNDSDNLFQPTKGFYKVWSADPKLQEAIGCAVQPSTTLAGNNVQEFANGEMLYGDQGFVYVIYADNTWKLYPDTSGHGSLLTPTPEPATAAPAETPAPTGEPAEPAATSTAAP
ncbi:MAG TPA: Ig-like domain-containing protein [Thermomicrobiaceae bacterium]|nr:Ig-like domain-containing protein [Thermomicrobiaceae bacterium]